MILAMSVSALVWTSSVTSVPFPRGAKENVDSNSSRTIRSRRRIFVGDRTL